MFTLHAPHWRPTSPKIRPPTRLTASHHAHSPEATAPDSTTITFIVLTSFFPESRRAVQFVAELAAPLGDRLVLLHSNHRGLLRKTSKAPADQQSTVYLEQALQEMAAGLGSPTTIDLLGGFFISAPV